MVKADIAVLLALGAAMFIAVGDVLHQRSAHGFDGGTRWSPRTAA